MANLLLHPNTELQLNAFTDRPSHAVIIVGPAGSGKASLASQLVEITLGIKPGTLSLFPYATTISPEEGRAIGVDTIRQLDRFLSLKVPSTKEFNRAVIIQNSQLMTLEAQNAMLKFLEEPPEGTIIALTSDSIQSLLPTIRSRAQIIHLTKPHEDSLKAYFENQSLDKAAIKQAYVVSGGLPGLMSSMLTQEGYQLSEAAGWARKLLSQSPYERLLVVDELSKNRQLAVSTVYILKRMAHVSLRQPASKSTQRWKAILRASYEASEQLDTNAQPKLVLTKLMLCL